MKRPFVPEVAAILAFVAAACLSGGRAEAQVTGTVKGDDVTIEYKVEGQGGTLAVKYSGKTDGKTMSGKVSLGQLGEGTFTGKKQ